MKCLLFLGLGQVGPGRANGVIQCFVELVFGVLLLPLRVLALIGHSLNDDEIGANLGISARTAETFRHRILKKMRVAGTPKLIRLATELGFTQIPELKP